MKWKGGEKYGHRGKGGRGSGKAGEQKSIREDSTMSETVASRVGVKVLTSDEREEIYAVLDSIEQDLLDGSYKKDAAYYHAALAKLRGVRRLMWGNDDE